MFKSGLHGFGLVMLLHLAMMMPLLACPACYLTPDQINDVLKDEAPKPPAPAALPPAPAPPQSIWENISQRLEQIQKETGQRISVELNRLKSRDSSWGLVWALALGFAYGALHALGPGHGKILILSYFAGQNARPRDGMIMGAQIAIFHVLSAVLAVLATEIFFQAATGNKASDFYAVRMISYALIAGCGAVMIREALAQRPHSCSHDNGAATCGHHHHSGDDRPTSRKQTLLSLAVGGVPCTGAVLVLAFSLANDLLFDGLMIVTFISLGMAMTLSMLGLAAIWSGTGLRARLSPEQGWRLTGTWLRAAGGVMIALFGLSLMLTAS